MTTDRSELDEVLVDGSYLASVVRLLWPAPARIGAPRRRLGRSSATPGSYVVIPSAARPKLLVPSRPRRVAAGAVRNYKTAASAREQLRISALALALRTGLHDWLPDHLTITPGSGGPAGIDAHLHDVMGRRVHVSLYIGPARAVRKPVLQVLDDRGTTVAFAKLGVDEFTTALVRAEAAAVARVAAAGTTALRVPDVLHDGTWNGHALLVQSALPRGTAATASSPLVARAVRELASVDGLTTGALGTSSYWARLTDRVGTLGPGPVTDRLTHALDEISRAHADLEFGCSHGDFAPWNMTIAGDTVLVWDWEKFERDVPLGLDAVHCDIQGGVVLGGASPAEAFAAACERAPVLLTSIGNAAAAELVVWLYAVDIATRYLVDREEIAGPLRMADLPDWLPGVLDRAAARSHSS
jgi:hypothetical protein